MPGAKRPTRRPQRMPHRRPIDLRSLRRSIARAREVIRPFGRQSITTSDTHQLLQAKGVRVMLADLPGKHPAILSPPVFGGWRALALSRDAPRLARPVLLLHEAGHLYLGSAELGITYDNDDWRTTAELTADAFATVGMLPKVMVDALLATEIWTQRVEDELAAELAFMTEDIWDELRSLTAAKNRLIVRERLGV